MPPVNLSPNDIEAIIERAVNRVLLRIGIAQADDGDAIELQRDFSYLRDLRMGSQAIKNKGLLVVVGIVITAVSTLIYFGIQFFLQHPPPPPPHP